MKILNKKNIMKIKLNLFILLLIPSFTIAQYNFSSDYVELCTWQESSQTWSDDCEQAEVSNLFVINEDETVMTLTNSESKQTLYIQGGDQYEEDLLVGWDVISDEGEELFVIFDFENRLIKILDLQPVESRWQMLIFNIKANW